MYFLILKNDQILGWTANEYKNLDGGAVCVAAPLDFQPEHLGEWICKDGEIVRDEGVYLARLKKEKTAAIRSRAELLIHQLDWKVERAKERETLGISDLKAVDEVLILREAIRRASNHLEAQTIDAENEQDLPDHYFDHSSDIVREEIQKLSIHRLTQHQFAARFTAEELAGILSAGNEMPTLKVWWEKFRMAEFINLHDESLSMGLEMLAIAGLLRSERVAEILSKDT